MRKKWIAPMLEVLEVKMTMKGFDPPWDWDQDHTHDKNCDPSGPFES